MALLHAEDIVNAEFTLALFHEEAVYVEHHHSRKQGEYRHAHPHESGQIISTLDALHSAVH